MVEVPIKMHIQNLAKQAREACRLVALLPSQIRQTAMLKMAEELEARHEEIALANKEDVEGISKDLGPDVYRQALERIRIDEEDVGAMAEGIRAVAQQPDPIGEVTSSWNSVEGMQISRVRVPLGVVAVISEMGPAVMTESIAMCLKTGNVCFYRGGNDWFRTNSSIATICRDAAVAAGVPAEAIVFLDRPEREGALEVVRLPKFIDGVVPRGKAGLRRAVMEQSRVPVLGYDGGACHVYIDGDAEIPLAQSIVVNSKIQDPAASNSADTVLIHQSVTRQLLPGLVRRLLDEFKVDLIGCPKTTSLLGIMEMSGHKGIQPAKDEHYGQKFQSLTLVLKIVKDLDEAISHIAAYGPGHTDAIVTRDYSAAMRFVREVNSSAVLVNASTRLNNSTEMNLGPEMGMNTLQAFRRGPLTLHALTSEKYVGFGFGHLRHPHPVPQTYHDAMMLSPKF